MADYEWEKLMDECGPASDPEREDLGGMIQNNMIARQLERDGKYDLAIKLYESIVAKEFGGNFPYDRLAIIYRKLKRYDDEIDLLNRAILVFERINKEGYRGDAKPKLDAFRDRLKKAKKIKAKDSDGVL